MKPRLKIEAFQDRFLCEIFNAKISVHSQFLRPVTLSAVGVAASAWFGTRRYFPMFVSARDILSTKVILNVVTGQGKQKKLIANK